MQTVLSARLSYYIMSAWSVLLFLPVTNRT